MSSIDSLSLSIKVWNSAEFTYTSKYDVIVDHFTKTLAQSSSGDENQGELLKVINEFVNLQYPIGALSQGSKKNLVSSVVNLTVDDPENIPSYVEALRALQMHPRMANFFNAHQIIYGDLVSRLFDQHLTLLGRNSPGNSTDDVKQHMKDLRTYCQYNLSSPDFESVFAKNFMGSLTKVTIQCQSIGDPVDQDYFSIIQLVFFNSEKTQKLRDYLRNFPKGDLDYFQLFDQDHVLLVFLDALLATFHNDKEMVELLLSCVFEKLPSDFNKREILVFRHVLFLLRKYDVNVSHYQVTIARISSLIMNIVAKKSQTHPVEVLDVICQAVQWNPMIIHDEVLVVIVHFMTVEKDPQTLVKFAELQRRVMGGRMNRFEKRTGKLLELVKGEMDKLINGSDGTKKRKAPVEATPSKKKKKLNDTSSVSTADSDDPDAHFMELLVRSYSTDTATEPTWDEQWVSLSNMWPKSVSNLWGNSVASLVSKTSMIIWKALLINLNESLEILKERSFDKQSVIYTRFVCCFVVEYLRFNRLLEQTDQQYETIEGMCAQTKEALKKFGKLILETEHDPDLVSAFLSVAIKYGSFETSLLYYHPDSIRDENENDGNHSELRTIDFKQKAHSVYDFLSTDEWSLIEQRVINFGKEGCRAMLQDLNFRKVRTVVLCDSEFKCSETKTWNKSIVGDVNLLSKFTDNCVYFDEFVRDLTRKQKVTLAKTLFQSNTDVKQKQKFVELIGEQYELVGLSALVILATIAENHLPLGSHLKTVDFDAILQQTEIEEIVYIEDGAATEKKKRKPLEDPQGLLSKIKLINSLPLGYLKEREKEIFYALHVSLCYDLTGNEELQDVVLENIRMIRELGFRFDGLKYLTLDKQLEMLPSRTGQSMVLDTVANYFGDAQVKQLKSLLKTLAKDVDGNKELILLMAERFCLAKKNHKNEKTMVIYKMKLNKLVFQLYEKDNLKSSAGLLHALTMYLTHKENLTEANPDLGKLCLRVAQKELEAVDETEEENRAKIVGYCFQHMEHLVLEQKVLEEILDVFWQKMKTVESVDDVEKKSKVDLLGLFNIYAATERYIVVLTDIADRAEQLEGIDNLRVVCKLMQILSKSRVNQAKGLVLSEYLKKILDIVIMRFTLHVENVYEYPEMVLDILKCFSVAALNRQIVMSQSLFTNILSFCLDINLKRFKVTEENTVTFDRIHQQLTQLCTNLIQARSLALKHAMPQFVSLLKDLIHTICAFRNERSDAKQKLSDEEIKMLSNLAHRLEPILNGFADRDHLGRKVAPYLLVYVINEMIFNPNSTTLYPGVSF